MRAKIRHLHLKTMLLPPDFYFILFFLPLSTCWNMNMEAPNYCNSVSVEGFASQSDLIIPVLSLICDIGKLFQLYKLIS